MEQELNGSELTRRDFFQGGAYLAAGVLGLSMVDVLAACGGSVSTPSGPKDAVQTAYDSFVAKEMPGVSIDLVRAAAKEGQVNWYALVPTTRYTDLVTKFQNIFPFIRVNLTSLNGGPLVAKFMAEARAKKASADLVLFSAVSDAVGADKEGFVASYKMSSEGKYNMKQGVSGKIFPASGEILAIAYNASRVKDSDVSDLKKWSGLLDSKWDGKRFAVGEVLAGGTTQLFNYYLFKQFKTTYWQRIAKSGYGIFPGGAAELAAVVSGDADLAVGLPASLCVTEYQKQAPIHWVNPQDWVVTPYAQFVTSTAQNPNAAKLLTEFTATVTGQNIITGGGGISYRKDIKGSGDWTKQSWYVAPDPTKFWAYSDADLGAAMPDIAKTWRSIIK